MVALTIISFALTLGILTAKVAVGVSAFNTIIDALSLSNLGQYKNFDQPVTDLITQCVIMLARFMDYIQLLTVLCAFLCIIFNSFKLWAGTTEIKKAFVDMIYKCVMVSALALIWPTVVSRTYALATNIGVDVSGGKDLLTYSFASVAGHTRDVFKDGMADYINMLKNGATTKDGKIVVSDKALKAFTDAGMTESEAKSWLDQNGISVDSNVKTKRLWIFNNEQGKAEKRAKKAFANQSEITTVDEYGNYIYIGSSNRTQYIKQNICVLRAMSEVLTGIPENGLGNVDITKVLNMGEESLKSVFYNPFIKGSNDRLSMSTMIKTSIILSNAFAEGSLAPFDDFSKYSPEEKQKTINQYFESQNMHLVLKLIGMIAKFYVYHLGMVISTLVIMIEYSISLIEFLLVASISALLIPFFFIDATKQFVTNLLRMIFSFFIKLLVTTMMCFFVMGMYLRMAESMYTRVFADTTTVLYYVFILMLGLVLSKSSGKIASSVITGSPSMGIGDIAQQFRGMTHAMHAMSRMAERSARDMQNVMSKGKNVARDSVIQGAANDSILDGQHAAAFRTGHQLMQERGEAMAKQARGEMLSPQEQGRLAMTDADIRNTAAQAGKNYAKQARKQFASDWMFSKLTGIDRIHGKEGALRVGQQFWDENNKQYRTATLKDVQEAGKLGGSQAADKAVQNAIKQFERKPDEDISLPESTQHKKHKNWPEAGH